MEPMPAICPVNVVGHVNIGRLALGIGKYRIPCTMLEVDIIEMNFAHAMACGSDHYNARIE
jgi:hypothetical protein